MKIGDSIKVYLWKQKSKKILARGTVKDIAKRFGKNVYTVTGAVLDDFIVHRITK